MRTIRCLNFIGATLAVAVFVSVAHAGAGWVNVQDYFPDDWQEQEQLDLREYIQEAVNENPRVFFPGGNNADDLVKYHMTTGLEVPEHHQLDFGPHHRLVRLPSEGLLIVLNDHARLSNAVIDGNKYAHWPEFEDLGKNSDTAIRMRSHTVVKDTVVFNNPGHAFGTWSDYNKLYRCRAENIGYIDVRYGAMHYAAARDGVSGDGFYIRGEGNLIKDSVAYDAQRWDFCSSHSGAKQNTYVDCRGGDVEFRTYGFIDIEDADDNNRLIRCISPNSHIAIPISARTEVIQCMASRITAWDRPESIERYEDDAGVRNHGLLLDGNITTEGGIVIGGWSSQRDQLVPGAASPIVVNNRMYKQHAGPSDGYSDWSFSIHAADGHGVVANNMLFEFDDGYTRGPGMNLDNVEGQNNQVVYGKWDDLDLPRPRLRYGYYDHDLIEQRAQAYAEEQLREYLAEAALDLADPQVHWLPLVGQFVVDAQDEGEAATWATGLPEEASARELHLTEHWTTQDADLAMFRGPGWYYLPFEWPAENGQQLYLFASAIDSEARIYVNGRLVGEHSGWDTPSITPIDAEARDADTAEQLLALKVWTPAGLAGIYGPLALLVEE